MGFFDETFQQYREILVKDALLLIEGKLRFDEFANTWVLRASKVSELERLREKEARRIVLKMKASDGVPLERAAGGARAIPRRRLPGRRAISRPQARAARTPSARTGTSGRPPR